MIDSWTRFQEIINEYATELISNNSTEKAFKSARKECLCLDKELDVFTGRSWEVKFEETDDKYSLYFGQGETFPEDKVGLAWTVDPYTIIFFERPYQNKPIKVLKKLLPNKEVVWDKNDIMIDGKKVGPSLPTGYGKREGHKIIINDGTTVTTTIVPTSDPNTGHIYCLRWSNLEGLNEKFKDIPHHQDRLNNKNGLTTLSEHLSITKEEFEKMLELDE